MPDTTKFAAVPSPMHDGVWYAWYQDYYPDGGVFIRVADGRSLVTYASESEARDAAWFAYGLTAPSGVQLELLL